MLEKRFGFRIAEYGLRQVYPRVQDHPVLAGFTPEHLRDWRGEATISPPRLKYELSPKFNGAPTVSWCGMPVTRAWRCGNRGNVASVLIEKPVRGDFLPVLDGGFSLQYSPLLEFREGQGLVVFCQLDVTGRTELEPVADLLVRRLLHYVSAWKPTLRKTVVYAGEPQGKTFLESLGMEVAEMGEDTLSPDRVLVLGPEPFGKVSGGAKLGGFLRNGGKILALGLTREEAASLPSPVELEKAEHISTSFEAFPANSPFAGIGPADTHNRDPRELPLVRAGAQAIGNGVLGLGQDQGLVICQLVPWHFDGARQSNLKRTHRRVSFLVSRLLGNLGVEAATPLLARFENPIPSGSAEQRWLEGFYLDKPEEWDDPYRFFRW